MPTTLPARPDRATDETSRLSKVLLAAYFASLVTFCGLLVIKGPQMRAAAEAQRAAEIDQESEAFCRKYGIRPETSRHAECAGDLMEIRRRHEQRIASDLLGVL